MNTTKKIKPTMSNMQQSKRKKKFKPNTLMMESVFNYQFSFFKKIYIL